MKGNFGSDQRTQRERERERETERDRERQRETETQRGRRSFHYPTRPVSPPLTVCHCFHHTAHNLAVDIHLPTTFSALPRCGRMAISFLCMLGMIRTSATALPSGAATRPPALRQVLDLEWHRCDYCALSVWIALLLLHEKAVTRGICSL
jgi:hypothetical protein